MSKIIHLATAVVVDPQRTRALVVRKHGSATFIQPGGKIDAGETAIEALRRELREEIGLEIREDEAVYLGHFTAPAVHETGFTVASEAFWVKTDKPVCAESEIAEIQWIDPLEAPNLPLAPLSRQLMALVVERLKLRGVGSATPRTFEP